MARTPTRTCRLAAALLVVALATVGCSYRSREVLVPIPKGAQSSTLYSADGTLITTFHAEENRRDVDLEEVPTSLRDAVIAIEDERFYRHGGVDLRALVRAARTNAEAGELAEGGSTITQQYVKLVLLRDSSKTFERKLQEASMAVQLERSYTKDHILELYLNAVYFGNGAYGVAAAAGQYFGKEIEDLALAESALLAGLIQRPSGTDPYDHPEDATARRNLVLDRMLRNHFASAADVEAAKATPLALGSPTTPAAERYPAPHFVEEVKQWILHDERFGATDAERRDLLFGGGLKIRTTIDLAAQADAEAAVAAILPDAGRDPDVALVSLVPDTGEVRALVGGRDFFGEGKAAKVDLATSGRQAGSSFKPLVLAAALAEGMPATTTYPAPGCYTVPDVEPVYAPCNYSDSESVASADLVEGTVHSYNTLFVQLMMDVGPKDAMEVANDLGITAKLKAVPSAVLGSNEVSPLDMASAYGTFANRGVRVPPVMVTRITRPDGTVLYRYEHEEEEAVEPAVADTVTAILEQVVQRGTGTAAALADRPVAGKTGTADEHHDAWFVGYTPQLATAVWVGFHEGQIPMEPPRTAISVTGGSYPARIWDRFMAAALADEPVEHFHAAPADAFGSTTTSSSSSTSLPGLGGNPGDPDPSRSSTTLASPRGPRGTAVVPDVVGRQQSIATATLRSSGFGVAGHTVRAPTSRSGTVLSQDPPAGETWPKGTIVELTIAE